MQRMTLLATVFFTTGVLAQPRTLIQNITIISPERDVPLHDAHVLLEEDRILSVTQGKIPGVTSPTKVVDGLGKFLIPGLIYAHVGG